MNKNLGVGVYSSVMGLAMILNGVSARADLPQAAPDCLDLAAYLGDIRRLPDSMYMHRLLLDMTVSTGSATTQASSLAKRHALDLFDHPDLTSFGIAAAKSGSNYAHTFMAYQNDCNKVVTGNIFTAEGHSVTWEIVDHSANQVTLKRVTQGGEAEISGDLTLVMRQFQAFTPTLFSMTSVYRLATRHACETQIVEKNAAVVTELFVMDDNADHPPVPSGKNLSVLQSGNPRVETGNGRRGDFVAPLTAQNDPVCAVPATIIKASASAR